jgi:hypothetical protein
MARNCMQEEGEKDKMTVVLVSFSSSKFVLSFTKVGSPVQKSAGERTRVLCRMHRTESLVFHYRIEKYRPETLEVTLMQENVF